MPELTIECPACKQPFTVSEEEQARNAELGYAPPTFCPACYEQRKATKDEAKLAQRRRSSRRRR